MGEVLTSSFSAPSRRLNVISPIPAPGEVPSPPERAPREGFQSRRGLVISNQLLAPNSAGNR